MLIEVRCYTCGMPVAQYYEEWRKRIAEGENPKEILDDLGLSRYCCRRMIITHVELLAETIKFSLNAHKQRPF